MSTYEPGRLYLIDVDGETHEARYFAPGILAPGFLTRDGRAVDVDKATNIRPAIVLDPEDVRRLTANLTAALEDERAARKVAGDAVDRFRDVVSEVLGLDRNPGDDALVEQLRSLHGKSGPEPQRWRNFVTGAVAHLEREGFTIGAPLTTEENR